MHHFIPHRRPKKLRHPVQTTEPVRTTRQSILASNLLIPSSSTKLEENRSQQSVKTNRKRFKLSSLTQFLHSFGKKSKTKNSTTQCDRSSTDLRPLSELLY